MLGLGLNVVAHRRFAVPPESLRVILRRRGVMRTRREQAMVAARVSVLSADAVIDREAVGIAMLVVGRV